MDNEIREAVRAAAVGGAEESERVLRMRARSGEPVAQRTLAVREGTSPVANFANRLSETQRTEMGGLSHRLFNAVRFPGEVTLSVQAGDGQYSAPRRVLPVGDHSYTAWELGTVPSTLGEAASLVDNWEGGWNEETDEWESGTDYPAFTVAGYVPTEVVQRLLDTLFIAHGTPTFDGSDPDPEDGGPGGENEHADNEVEFSEMNSGGSYWLSMASYQRLAEAGWRVDTDDRRAWRTGLSDEDAIAEWAEVTGEDPDAKGCECCGRPFNFF